MRLRASSLARLTCYMREVPERGVAEILTQERAYTMLLCESRRHVTAKQRDTWDVDTAIDPHHFLVYPRHARLYMVVLTLAVRRA